MPSAKDFCNPMQIVKVEPLAEINAIFSVRECAAEYNIDGFDTRRRRGYSIGVPGVARGEMALATPHYLLNYRRGIVNRYRARATT